MDDLSQSLQTVIREAARLPGDPPVTPDEPDGTVKKDDAAPVQDFVPLQKYYGIDELDDKTTNQLETIWNYYKNKEDINSPGDILKAIRAAHMSMVQPQIGQTRLSQLADYVKILADSEDIAGRKQAYERLTKK